MTTTTDPTTSPTSLRPPDADAQKDTLATHLSAILQIRGYCLAVEQTVLTPIKDPPPDWFTTLNSNLSTAQTHSTAWTSTLEPAITSKIPQAVITTGNHFTVAANQILTVLQDSNNNPSSAQQQQIVENLQWMQTHLGDNQTTITGLADQFGTFQTNAGADYTTLSAGATSIQAALNVDNDTITHLQGDILQAQADIAADQAAITASGIAAGVGLFVGVAVVGLGAAASGPAAPVAIVIGAFIIVGALAEAATVIAIYANKLAAAQTRLNDDQSALSNEQQQVASLTLLQQSISNLTDANKAMGQSLVEIADWWQGVQDKIGAVITDVQDAQQDEGYWQFLNNDVQAATSDWGNFVQYATSMQNITSGANVEVQNVGSQNGS